jgi:putative RNA 2'-phosphotransferase
MTKTEPRSPHEKLSVFLCYVLRHDSDGIGVDIDDQGWVLIDDLLTKANASGKQIDRQTLDEIVKKDSKKRYGITADGLKIRCVQGHSNPKVKIKRAVQVPKTILYHGTATKNVAAILKSGILPRTRHEVHLSETIETAIEVGARHGTPVVLEVDAKALYAAGKTFTRADNGVWLVDQVPARYIREIDVPAPHTKRRRAP